MQGILCTREVTRLVAGKYHSYMSSKIPLDDPTAIEIYEKVLHSIFILSHIAGEDCILCHCLGTIRSIFVVLCSLQCRDIFWVES